MSPARRLRYRRLVRLVVPAVAFALLAVVLVFYFQRGVVPGDAFTYLAAGERLNAGHPLYALSPGDRPVEMHPPYWTVPLLSPPFIAVVARPFALFGDAGAYLWWGACLLGIGVTVLALLRRRPVTVALAMLALLFPLAYELGVGNVNGLLLAAAVGCWLLVRDGHAAAAGPLAIAMVAGKLTPLPIAAWVAGAGGRRGLRGLVAGAAGMAAVSLAGAGLEAHFRYVEIMRTTTTAGLSPASLGGVARALGLPEPIPALLPTAALVLSTLLAMVLAARGRPGVGFVLAVVGWTFGSPVVNINTPTLLFAALAPLAWPWSERQVRTATPDLPGPPGSRAEAGRAPLPAEAAA